MGSIFDRLSIEYASSVYTVSIDTFFNSHNNRYIIGVIKTGSKVVAPSLA